MSDATFGSLMGLADDVAAYVRDVRVELADLPIEDVDDLTGGMEADLSELAAESGGDLVGRLGSPALYAAELRSAAGLPERVVTTGRWRPSLGGALTNAASWFTRLIERHPWLRPVTAFLVTLRPAWWVLRGYVVAWALWSMVLGGDHDVRPRSFKEFTIALALIVLSVQIGRGWMGQRALSRPLVALANSVAAWLILVALVTPGNVQNMETYTPPPGLSLNGLQVDNIYAYDSEGKRVSGVRLFDQAGRPLDANVSLIDNNGNPAVIPLDGSGASVTNVYPRTLFGSDPWHVSNPADPQPDSLVWSPPVSIVPLAPRANTTPTPTASSTASPTAPPTSTATPSATPGSGKPLSPAPTPTSAPKPSVARSVR